MFGLSRQGKAIWFLAFLSPVVAEMGSGSAPFAEWLNPVAVATFLGMYGAGAILVRELTIRWDKGWATIIILGAAYGIIEEGIAVKSFFDPNWVDLGDLGTYGRYLDVNWVWSVWLTIFHSMVSIALVLLAFGLIYPGYKGIPLLTERRFRIVAIIFVLDILLSAIGFVYIQDYVPPIGWYLLSFIVVAGLMLLAWRVPKNLVSARHEFPTWSNASFFSMGFLSFPVLIITAGSANDALHPIFVIVILLVLCAGILLVLQHKMGAKDNEIPKAYYVAGFLSFFVLFSFINELTGMITASIGGMILLVLTILMIHKVRSYARPNKSIGPLTRLRNRWRRRTVSNR